MTKLTDTIYETGQWPKNFIEFKIIALEKRTKATKCSDRRTTSLITHTANAVVSVHKITIGEDEFAFRRGKETRDSIGMLIITSKRILGIDDEFLVVS